ncbi:unnamed protein product [Leptidea sinapis]|uniref:Uncharacterized protein n=1 Tax=Leptidea sinapis TaxID=189913 RepID=A0A5E4QZY9_9NEOP|nr:unnamed protein product [Leptidea sinapis]
MRFLLISLVLLICLTTFGHAKTTVINVKPVNEAINTDRQGTTAGQRQGMLGKFLPIPCFGSMRYLFKISSIVRVTENDDKKISGYLRDVGSIE